MVHDGLWDPYNNQHMGLCAEKCASDYSISREEQDKYAIESYSRVKLATEEGRLKDEIVPVEITGRKVGCVSVYNLEIVVVLWK